MTISPAVSGFGPDRVLVGLAGRGILQSRTPWMHEQEADAQGFRLVYSLFDFNDRGWADWELAPLLDAAQRIGDLDFGDVAFRNCPGSLAGHRIGE